MTCQEYYEALYKEYEEASDKYLKLDNELFQTQGFGDFSSLPDLRNCERKVQIATNNYWNFLSFIKGKNINPSDEFVLK